MPLYIGVCKQNMAAISNNKKVCFRCSVLRLCSKHRPVRELMTLARAQLACPNALEPLEFVSGECSSNINDKERGS